MEGGRILVILKNNNREEVFLKENYLLKSIM